MNSKLRDRAHHQTVALFTHVVAFSTASGLFVLAGCHRSVDASTPTSTTTTTGDTSTSGTWDPRQPGPNELYPATDGSPDYLRSVIPTNPKLDPNSSAMIGAMGCERPRLNGPEWQMTIYTGKNSDPVYNPTFTHGPDWGCSVGGSIHIPDQSRFVFHLHANVPRIPQACGKIRRQWRGERLLADGRAVAARSLRRLQAPARYRAMACAALAAAHPWAPTAASSATWGSMARRMR